MVHRDRKPAALWTLGLEKSCQGNHSMAPSLLPPQFPNLGHSCAGDLRSSTKIPLQLVLRFRESEIVRVQGHWDCRNHAKGITAEHQHFCLHIFLIWVTRGDMDLCLSTKVPLLLELGLEFRKPVQLRGHRGWKSHAKGIMAGHQHCCLQPSHLSNQEHP